MTIDPITDMPKNLMEYATELSKDAFDVKMVRLWRWYREKEGSCPACGGPYPTKAVKTGLPCKKCGNIIPRMTMIMPLPGSLEAAGRSTGEYMREAYLKKRIAAWYRTQRTLRKAMAMQQSPTLPARSLRSLANPPEGLRATRSALHPPDAVALRARPRGVAQDPGGGWGTRLPTGNGLGSPGTTPGRLAMTSAARRVTMGAREASPSAQDPGGGSGQDAGPHTGNEIEDHLL